MRRKAPNDKYKTLTASIPPELHVAFNERTEREGLNKSDLVASLINAWLSGGNSTECGSSAIEPSKEIYLSALQIESQKLQSRLKKIQTAKKILQELEVCI